MCFVFIQFFVKRTRAEERFESESFSRAALGVHERKALFLLEGVAILVYQLIRSRSNADRAAAVAAFARSFTSESLTEKILELWKDVSYIESQSSTPNVDDALGKLRMFRTSRGFLQLQKFLLFVVSHGLFHQIGIDLDSVGYTRLEAKAIKKKYSSKMDFLECVLETFSFVVNAGYQIVEGKDVGSVLHSGSGYQSLIDETDELLKLSAERDAAPMLNFVDFTKLLKQTEVLSKKFDEVMRVCASMSPPDRSIVKAYRLKVDLLYARLRNSEMTLASRQAPFTLLIHGSSGVGKSTFVNLVRDKFANVRDLPVEGSTYTRSPHDAYWSGYSPSQWCVIFDDLAWKHPKAGGEMEQSMSEIIMCINNTPFLTNQAELEAKGQVACIPHLVLATTNTMDLNVKHHFACPTAARRRFTHTVSLRPKEVYAGPDGMLNSSLVHANGDYEDVWNILVTRVNISNTKISHDVVLQTESIDEFYRWMHVTVDDFTEGQERVLREMNQKSNEAWCESCYTRVSRCSCQPLVQFESESLALYNVFCYICFYYLCRIFTINRVVSLYSKYAFYKYKIYFYGALAWYRLRVRGAMARDEFALLGTRVESFYIRKPVFFRVMATLLVTIGIALALHKSVSSESFSKPVYPSEMQRERAGYDYSNYVPTTSFPMSTKSKCIVGSDLAERVRRNSHRVTFLKEGLVELQEESMILGLGGDIFVCNNHSIPQGVTQIIYNDVQRGGIGRRVHFKFDDSQIMRFPERDLAFFRFIGVGNRVDLVEFLPTKPLLGHFNGLYSHFDGEGLVFDGVKSMYNSVARSSKVPFDVPVITAEGKHTKVGDCGCPVIVSNTDSGAALGGLHAFGRKNSFGISTGACFVPLDRSFVDPVISKLRGVQPIGENPPTIGSESVSRSVVTLHKKSVFRYIPEGAADVYGSLTGFRANPKSRVQDTPLRSDWEKYGINTDFTKPDMTTWRPWRIAALDLVQPIRGMDNPTLFACVDAFEKDLISRLDPSMFSMMHRVPEDVAVNGMPGVTYVDSINRTTSMGSPYNTPKGKFLRRLDSEIFQDGVEFTDEVRRRMQDIRDCYSQRKLWRPVFTAHLKDEPVSAKKAAIGKTRVFCGAPIDWTVVVRELFLGHIRLIMNNKFDFECAVGVVAQSTEWSSAYAHVTKYGDNRIVAGDYKSFDKKMAPALILSAFDILIRLAKRSGNFTPDDIGAMWCVAYDTAYPMVNYNGDLVQFWGSNPSGHPLTTIINSLANSLYVRYAFAKAGGDLGKFSEQVSLLTYGDDNIMSVSDECDFFDHTVLQNRLAEVGVVYTMADKESESRPFIHIDEATFLKRRWVYNYDYCVYQAPLEQESIDKMLCVSVMSKSVTAEEQMFSIIRSALMESFFHGKEHFDNYFSMFSDVLAQHEEYSSFLESYPLVTYNEFWELFFKNSAGTISQF